MLAYERDARIEENAHVDDNYTVSFLRGFSRYERNQTYRDVDAMWQVGLWAVNFFSKFNVFVRPILLIFICPPLAARTAGRNRTSYVGKSTKRRSDFKQSRVVPAKHRTKGKRDDYIRVQRPASATLLILLKIVISRLSVGSQFLHGRPRYRRVRTRFERLL